MEADQDPDINDDHVQKGIIQVWMSDHAFKHLAWVFVMLLQRDQY